MELRHLYTLAVPSDPALSADAALVAFTVSRPREASNDYQTQIVVVRMDGAAIDTKVTAGGDHESGANWRPDGRAIAFLSDVGCVARGQSRLWLAELDGGATRAITPPLDAIRDLAWSPDGARLAFTATGDDQGSASADGVRRITRLGYRSEADGWAAGHSRHIFVVEATGAHVLTQVSHGPYRHNGAAWSPAGDCVITVSARHSDRDIDKITNLYSFELEAERCVQLTEEAGQCLNPTWQPSGRYIAFFFNARAYYGPSNWQAAVAEPARGMAEVRTLTDVEMLQCRPAPEHQRPVWTEDGRILFTVEQRGESALLAASPSSRSSPERVVDVDGTIAGFDQKRGQLVLIRSKSDQPAELWHHSRPLTRLSAEFVAAAQPQRAQRFAAAGVDAWIIPPAGSTGAGRTEVGPSESLRTAPVLVSLHGGPFTQYGDAFLEDFQVYSRAGFAVIYANPRGSSGYGEKWGRAIVPAPEAASRGGGGGGLGGADAQDVLSVLDAALAAFPYCDPDRLGLIGGSYGGTLALHLLSQTDRFTAACVERGVSDFQSFYGTSDFGIDFASYCGPSDSAGWRACSPLAAVDAITTPVLIIHSEDDVRVPIGQAEQLFTALRVRHREVEMLRFPAGGHELSRKGPPRLRVARLDAIVAWFRRWLLEIPSAPNSDRG